MQSVAIIKHGNIFQYVLLSHIACLVASPLHPFLFQATKEAFYAKGLWQDLKQDSKEAWEEGKQVPGKVWERTKEGAGEVWETMKEGGNAISRDVRKTVRGE